MGYKDKILTLESCKNLYSTIDVTIKDENRSELSKSSEFDIGSDLESDLSKSSESDITQYGQICNGNVSIQESKEDIIEKTSGFDRRMYNCRYITSDTSITEEDEILIVNPKIAITIQLPYIPLISGTSQIDIIKSRKITIKNYAVNTNIRIMAQPDDKINDISTYILKGKEKIDIIHIGSMWVTF